MITNQTERLNFASTKNIPAYPDFLDVQVKSFQDFFQLETKSDERGNEGLYNTFMENFPITDTRNFVVGSLTTLWIHHVIQFKNV
jgi:DNA-directed RNA polymerase subunit beta